MLARGCCEYKIIRILPNHLILARTSTRQKFIYRQINSEHLHHIVGYLRRLKDMHHPALLQLNDIVEDDDCMGLYIEHYTSSLESQLMRQVDLTDEQSLLNTLQPIREAIEYMHTLNQHPTGVAPRNIVVTQDGEIKFVDDVLLIEGVGRQPHHGSNEQDYGRFLQTALLLTEGSRPQPSKSTKLRLKKLRSKTGRSLFNFLSDIHDKANAQSLNKTKRIRKRIVVNNENKQRANPRTKLLAQQRKSSGKCESIDNGYSSISIKPLN